MTDLHDPRLMYLKAGLLLLGGALASVILLLDHPSLRTAALLGLAVWCFARAYYFAFYVIQHYIDGSYRYAGLWSAARHVARRGRRRRPAGGVTAPRPRR